MVDTSAENRLFDCVIHIVVCEIVRIANVRPYANRSNFHLRVEWASEVLMVDLEGIDLVLVHRPAVELFSALFRRVAAQTFKVHEVWLLNIMVLLLVHVDITKEVIYLAFHRVNLRS